MNKELNITEVLDKICKLKNDVKDYIVNTEHNLFYWITNKEVEQFIHEYPEDYEIMYSIDVNYVSGSSAHVKITFTNHPDEVEYIERYCVLPTFRDSVKARYMEHNGKLMELRKKELKNAIEYYNKKITEFEKELEELEKCQKKN